MSWFNAKNIIGQGEYGTVYACNDTKQAIKVQYIESNASIREYAIMSFLDHSNLMGFNKIEKKSKTTVAIYMEKGASLYDINYIQDIHRTHVESIIFSLLSGLYYMHVNGIMHRDLKIENVLVFDGMCNTVKICDFGLSKYVKNNGTSIDGSDFHTGEVQTLFSRSPEVAAGRPYGFKADMWSIGIMILELLSGNQFTIDRNNMFNDSTEMEFVFAWGSTLFGTFRNVDNYASVDLSYDRKQCMSKYLTVDENDPLIDLAIKCCAWDPSNRLTALQALNHKCFDEYKVCNIAPTQCAQLQWCNYTHSNNTEFTTRVRKEVFSHVLDMAILDSIRKKNAVYAFAIIDAFASHNTIDEKMLTVIGGVALFIVMCMTDQHTIPLEDCIQITEIYTKQYCIDLLYNIAYSHNINLVNIEKQIDSHDLSESQWGIVAVMLMHESPMDIMEICDLSHDELLNNLPFENDHFSSIIVMGSQNVEN
jgi:serine/threonine protein kinase